VTVKLTAEKGQLRLSVEDDGKGLAGTPAEGRGMGMIGMRARARIAGGELTERSHPGQGVLIEVRLPIPDETDSHSAG
jgi:signal transduction histidine kinase